MSTRGNIAILPASHLFATVPKHDFFACLPSSKF